MSDYDRERTARELLGEIRRNHTYGLHIDGPVALDCVLNALARAEAHGAEQIIKAESWASVRAWAAVRAGLEPDAYRDGKWDLHHAIQHRIQEAEAHGEVKGEQRVWAQLRTGTEHDERP